MSEIIQTRQDSSVNWYMTYMPPDAPIPPHVYMPWSTMQTFRHIARHPDPEDVYALTIPALRAFHEVARQKVRSSMNTTALLPFLNTENTSSLTRGVQQWMYDDRNRLPKQSRLRRVMGNAVYGTDADFLSQDVTVEEFVRETRPSIVRNLLSHYLGLPGARRIANHISERSSEQIAISPTQQALSRIRTKYFIPALDAIDDQRWRVKHRWVEMVIDQGVWENDPEKPYLDFSLHALQNPIGNTHRTRLISIGTAPNFSGTALSGDIRRAPWTLTWDHLGDADLVPIESLGAENLTRLAEANHQARMLMRRSREHPERRTQVDGVFAQNDLVRGLLPPYFSRLRRDMFIHESPETRDVLLQPMHCDQSLREQIPTKILGQAKRAVRKDAHYGSIIKRSEKGRAHLEEHGIAVDAETIALFREVPTPQALRRELRAMSTPDREYFLDDQMTEDLTTLHDPFSFIKKYKTLGLFRFYSTLGRIKDHEWENVYTELEKILGSHETFSKRMYIINHPREIGFKTEDGRRSPFDMWMVGDIFNEYKNPYEAFIEAIRNAKVRSPIVRYEIHPAVPFLETLDRLLTIDT